MNKHNGFKVAALAASIALAMTATSAMAAAPTATQLPGKGDVVSGVVGVGDIANNAQSIDITGHAVINWGKGTDINKDGVGGFNIGSAATLTFNGTSGADPSSATDAVLNIDSSGNASQIFGNLDTTNGASVFVTNANGIIVGDGAQIDADGYVGLIANDLGTAQDDFFDMSFNGTGGDITVQSGASITAGGLLVSGGGNVNVDLDGINAEIVGLSAGQPFGTDHAFSTVNKDASLSVSGAGDVILFSSAGNASSSGDLTIVDGSSIFDQMDLPVSSTDVAGTFTNTGTLALSGGYEISGALVNERAVDTDGEGDVSFGSLINDGQFTAHGDVNTTDGGLTNNGQMSMNDFRISVTGGDFANNGQIAESRGIGVEYGNFANKGSITLWNDGEQGVGVYGGDFVNAGSIGSVLDEDGNALYGEFIVVVQDGSITNSGQLEGFSYLRTGSSSDDDAFTAGADYGISNSGSISFGEGLHVTANDDDEGRGADNDSTGSFTNTGVLDVGSDTNLSLDAFNDLTLGGSVTVGGKAMSATNPLGHADVEAYNGVLSLSTPLVSDYGTSVVGGQVKIMADITNVEEGEGSIWVASAPIDGSDYDIRIANGVTLSATEVGLKGYNDTDHPSVILQGTVEGNYIYLGDDDGIDEAIGDVFAGPNGGLMATGDNPQIQMDFTGRIKSAPYLNDSNFRYNYLPITVDGSDPVYLELDPVAYDTNGTSNGLSAINILVNGSVELGQHYAQPSVGADGTAVTGVTNIPNTHLVLQSTGNIEVGDNVNPGPNFSVNEVDSGFYWPGYVYLGTIAANDDGSAAPGTLGLGTISLNGGFNNALPGDVSGASGVHFITQFPLSITGDVITNANAWVNFGTDLLAQGYASGTLGGSFYGGTQAAGTVVNYGELDPSMFHTHAPVATK